MMQQKLWRKIVKGASLISLLTSTRRFNQHLYLLVLGWKERCSGSRRPIDGKSILAHIDYYSSYPEAYISQEVTSREVIIAFTDVFIRFGFPEEMVSDNEKQFFSGGFKAFLKCCRIEHVYVSPYCARSNGKSVRFHRYVKENFRAAISAAKSWKIKPPKFFMLYGASLHQISGKSPGMLLFNRELWTKLPHIELDSINIGTRLRTSVKMRFVSSAFERLSRIALSLNRRSNIFCQDEAKRIRFKFRCVLARNHWDQSERHF